MCSATLLPNTEHMCLVAKTAVAPLDRVKILFQVSNPSVQQHAGSLSGIMRAMGDINRLHGIPGLFQGHMATLLRIFPYAAIKFMAFEQFKVVIEDSNMVERDTGRFLAGSLAGLTSVFFTYPMDMLRTRMAYEVESPVGILAMSRNIYLESPVTRIGGLSNFYRGFIPTLMGVVPYGGVSFWCYSKITNYFQTQIPDIAMSDNQLKAWAELASGGLAGAVAQTVSYPLEVIRRRMQVGGRFGPRQSIYTTITEIYVKNGLRGYFAGLSIGYIKVTPMTAISFFTYVQMKRLLEID
ncbi:coenzyme A transporter, variant 2 [Entomophthora muscae]|uniref:Coenzyme A transporter, variant 2 n=2 Tax=Entomophthora muscae TaxID=34485 RepID=A0ACC2UKG9_9FUNG|nr:coenzyme A transporter, variant 2 [Entomophthora muscae]